MKRVLFLEFWSINPHLETSFELAKIHLDKGDIVCYYFCGHDVPYKERVPLHPSKVLFQRCLPERKGARLIKNRRFFFYPRVDLQKYQINANEKFQDLKSLMEFKYKNCEIGISVASSLIFDTRESNPDLNFHENRINQMIQSGIIAYEFAKDLFTQEKPDLVYIFNGRFCHSRPIMNACDELDIKYLIHERGANKFRYSLRPFMPHNFAKIEEEMHEMWNKNNDPDAKKLACHFFQLRRQGQEIGWRSFTKNQIKGKIPKLAKDKKIVTYFSSSDDEFKAIGDIVKWDRWPDQERAVANLIKICEELPQIQLVIRIHPHKALKSEQDQAYWMNLKLPEGGVLIPPNDETDTYELIEKSDIVVTSGSTVGIESVFWGTPSICLGPSMYSTLNAVYLPKNEGELKEILLAENLEVQPDRALPYGYHKSTFGHKFQYYQPITLFDGNFLGVNLRKTPRICTSSRLVSLKNKVFRILKKQI